MDGYVGNYSERGSNCPMIVGTVCHFTTDFRGDQAICLFEQKTEFPEEILPSLRIMTGLKFRDDRFQLSAHGLEITRLTLGLGSHDDDIFDALNWWRHTGSTVETCFQFLAISGFATLSTAQNLGNMAA